MTWPDARDVPADEPGHAAPRDSAGAPPLGRIPPVAAVHRGRRVPRLPRRLRLPRGAGATAAAARLRDIRFDADVRPRLRDDGQPGPHRRAAHRHAAHRGRDRGRLAQRREDLPPLGAAPSRRRRHPGRARRRCRPSPHPRRCGRQQRERRPQRRRRRRRRSARHRDGRRPSGPEPASRRRRAQPSGRQLPDHHRRRRTRPRRFRGWLRILGRRWRQRAAAKRAGRDRGPAHRSRHRRRPDRRVRPLPPRRRDRRRARAVGVDRGGRLAAESGRLVPGRLPRLRAPVLGGRAQRRIARRPRRDDGPRAGRRRQRARRRADRRLAGNPGVAVAAGRSRRPRRSGEPRRPGGQRQPARLVPRPAPRGDLRAARRGDRAGPGQPVRPGAAPVRRSGRASADLQGRGHLRPVGPTTSWRRWSIGGCCGGG